METLETFPELVKIGDRVREARKWRSWSQQALADRAEVTAQTVWLLETHKLDDAKLSTLVKIAAVLGVSLAELLTD
jgi:transcriptional regulator with XRE-family HTH domain